jgi:hypothetical protein
LVRSSAAESLDRGQWRAPRGHRCRRGSGWRAGGVSNAWQLLFGLTPYDAATYVVVLALLGVVATCASYVAGAARV